MVKYLCESGVDPEEIGAVIPWKKNRLFEWFEGKLDPETFERVLAERQESRGKKPQPWRNFVAEGELIYANGRTYAFDRMWGHSTVEAMELIARKFNDRGVSFRESDLS
jgi:hypothetical protein